MPTEGVLCMLISQIPHLQYFSFIIPWVAILLKFPKCFLDFSCIARECTCLSLLQLPHF